MKIALALLFLITSLNTFGFNSAEIKKIIKTSNVPVIINYYSKTNPYKTFFSNLMERHPDPFDKASNIKAGLQGRIKIISVELKDSTQKPSLKMYNDGKLKKELPKLDLKKGEEQIFKALFNMDKLKKSCFPNKKLIYVDVITQCNIKKTEKGFICQEWVKPMWCCKPGCDPLGEVFGESYLREVYFSKNQNDLEVIQDNLDENGAPYRGCDFEPREHRYCICKLKNEDCPDCEKLSGLSNIEKILKMSKEIDKSIHKGIKKKSLR